MNYEVVEEGVWRDCKGLLKLEEMFGDLEESVEFIF